MAGSDFDPGGVNGPPQPHINNTYADRLKANVKYDQRLQRNILEIILQSENSESLTELKEDDMKQLFDTIGIDIKNELEGYIIKKFYYC